MITITRVSFIGTGILLIVVGLFWIIQETENMNNIISTGELDQKKSTQNTIMIFLSLVTFSIGGTILIATIFIPNKKEDKR